MLETKNIWFAFILFSKFSDVLPAFTYARAIGNLLGICLRFNILSPSPFVAFLGNIPLLKALRITSQTSERAHALSKVSFYLYLLLLLV